MPEIISNTVDGIFYRKMGSGPAFFLIHGFPESGSVWRKIWTSLAASFTVIVPDLPGSGGSQLEGEKSLEEMAVALKSICDTEGIQSAILAGHSMGGYVALAFAAQYPENVAGLSLIHSTTAADDEEKRKNRRKAIDIVKNGGKQMFLRQSVNGLFSENFKLNQPEFVEEQIVNTFKISEEGIINFYNEMIARPDRSAVLEKATFPVQWIFGKSDTIIPYKNVLPNCTKAGINFISLYSNAAHMGMFENAEQLGKDLKEFAGYCYTRK